MCKCGGERCEGRDYVEAGREESNKACDTERREDMREEMYVL